MLTFVNLLVLLSFTIRMYPRRVQGESSGLKISDDLFIYVFHRQVF